MKSKSNVLVFVLIAYGFSWLFWIPEALIAQICGMHLKVLKIFLRSTLGHGVRLLGRLLRLSFTRKVQG